MPDAPGPVEGQGTHHEVSGGLLAASPNATGILPWRSRALATLGWFGLWCLTPGLLNDGIETIFTTDPASVVLIETLLALLLAVVLVSTHRRDNQV